MLRVEISLMCQRDTNFTHKHVWDFLTAAITMGDLILRHSVTASMRSKLMMATLRHHITIGKLPAPSMPVVARGVDAWLANVRVGQCSADVAETVADVAE